MVWRLHDNSIYTPCMKFMLRVTHMAVRIFDNFNISETSTYGTVASRKENTATTTITTTVCYI